MLNKINKMFLGMALVLCSFVYTQTVEVGFGTVDTEAGSMELTINTPVDVAGFQFDVLGTQLTLATGGIAEDSGFTVSVGGTTILGFSFSGSVIPAGSDGVLTNVTFTADDGALEACLDLGSGAISDADGNAVDVVFGDCAMLAEVVEGCTDMAACNYDENANTDDGSCTYPEGTCDCDGNPTDDYCDCDGNMEDCSGECGGDAVVDDCGECGGDGTTCTESLSFGSWTGDALDIMINVGVDDLAGFQFVVSGINMTGASGGLAEDAGFTVSVNGNTGIVLGFAFDGSVIPAGSSGILTTLAVDGTTNIEACLSDAVFSDSNGDAVEYLLGECLTLCSDGDADGDGICDEVDDCIGDYDCNGDCNGDAVIDDCGECGGDGVDEDGDGICDDIDDCVGEYDDCGVCNGDDTSCLNVIYFGSVFESDTSNTMDIWLSAVDTVAGFQFDITGVTLNDAFGGVEDAGWTVSFNESGTVIGFDFGGATLAPGEHWLTTVDFNVADYEGCLTFDNDGALADANGDTLNAATGDCVTFTTAVAGCTDVDACNYDEDANVDDGSCTYPAEGECDCDGNVEDCAGECGGDAVIDECGDCDGDGPSYECEDGTLVCDESECASTVTISFGNVAGNNYGGDGAVEILYDTNTDIAGFQFTVSGVILDEASGGAAEDSGFTVSVGANTGIVIGFAFDGSVVPMGSGVLTNLHVTGIDSETEACLSDVIISDTNGGSFDDIMTGECANVSLLEIVDNMPLEYSLSQNYPNPFNPTTNISFSIVDAGQVSLKVYDLSGKEIIDLANGFYVPGTYNLKWNAVDSYGNQVSSGIYIYQLHTEKGIFSNSMILMR